MTSIITKAQDEHDNLLRELIEVINPDDQEYKYFIQKLKTLGIPEGMLDGVKKDPMEVFNLMSKRGFLGVGNYELLENAIEFSKDVRLLNILKERKKLITDLMTKGTEAVTSVNIQEPATMSSIKPEEIIKLRSDLIKLYKPLRGITVSPIFEMERCPFMDVYVDLDLVIVPEKDESSSKTMVIKSKKDKTITSYKQIFQNGRGSRVFIRGKGGLGKTTFCRKVLDVWCKVHEGEKVAQDGLFQDEATLKMFDILFYVNLREVTDDKDLIEVIYDKLRSLPTEKSFLKILLKDNGDKILFILDGLDEMNIQPGFIKNRVYPNCYFLVSSRPWKISKMELHVGYEIDLLFDLQGFSERNCMRFAEKIFKSCYNDHNVIQQFEKYIAKKKVAKQLTRVPLLLLFMLHYWYKNRSLPDTFHELYISFLNMVVERYKEKYKNDPNLGKTNFKLGGTQPALPRKLSETKLVKIFGEQFFISLCMAAHHFLFNSQKENSLVFERSKLQNAVGERGEEMLDMSLKLGLLSETASKSYLNKESTVSFLHKTVQEFLTASYFTFSPDKLDNFRSSMVDMYDVMRHENIIIFLVGLMPELGNSVLEKVNELYRNDWDEESGISSQSIWHGDEWISYSWIFSHFTSVYYRCKEEVIGENVQLNISCLYLERQSIELNWMNPAFLQILVLHQIQFPEDRADLRGFIGLSHLGLYNLNCELYLPESHVLAALIVNCVTLIPGSCDALDRTQKNCTKVKKRKIDNMHLHNNTLDLSNLVGLRELNLSGVTLSSDCCEVLCRTLINCTKLNKLSIKNMNLSVIYKCVLDLSNMTELTQLVMSNLMLSSDCCDVLCRTLGNCTKLNRLYISNIYLHNGRLDLSNMFELRELILAEVTVSSDCCDVVGRTLGNCAKLNTLHIVKTPCDLRFLKYHTFGKYPYNMKGLNYYTFDKDMLDLSKHCIFDTDLHNCMLNLENMTALKELCLSEVKLTSDRCDMFCRTLGNCTKLEKLTIFDMDLHNGMMDLSNMTELTQLVMSVVKLSSDCCDVLSLRNCKCVLDLSNMTELTFLSMSEVTLNSVSCDQLGKTMMHCTKLAALKLHKMNLHNFVLDLSNMTELTLLELSGVALNSASCDMLGKTIMQCTKLMTLEINNMNLHNFELDFSKMTKLEWLKMSEVTLSRDCCAMLGKAMIYGTKLKGLMIRNMNLHNCVLDLSKMTELRRLKLSEVTLNGACCDMLVKTIQHCSKLYSLIIDNMNLHNCVFDLSKMTRLIEVNIAEDALNRATFDMLEFDALNRATFDMLEFDALNRATFDMLEFDL